MNLLIDSTGIDGWLDGDREIHRKQRHTAKRVFERLRDEHGFTGGYHQPITRDGLKGIFGKEISRDLIGRLNAQDLIATGPSSPRRGAPYTFVTTETFLVAFGLEILRDLPDKEQLQDAGGAILDL